MNIFYVDHDPSIAAKSLVDRHVVKMILESAQLLSTAHRLVDGTEYKAKSPKTGRNIRRWRLPPNIDSVLYHATHVNHPSAIWTRESQKNYTWLFNHFVSLLEEYTYRYDKNHKCSFLVDHLANLPSNLNVITETPIKCAMDPQYIVSSDPVENYRNYYKSGKTHLHKWTRRNKPIWI